MSSGEDVEDHTYEYDEDQEDNYEYQEDEDTSDAEEQFLEYYEALRTMFDLISGEKEGLSKGQAISVLQQLGQTNEVLPSTITEFQVGKLIPYEGLVAWVQNYGEVDSTISAKAVRYVSLYTTRCTMDELLANTAVIDSKGVTTFAFGDIKPPENVTKFTIGTDPNKFKIAEKYKSSDYFIFFEAQFRDESSIEFIKKLMDPLCRLISGLWSTICKVTCDYEVKTLSSLRTRVGIYITCDEKDYFNQQVKLLVEGLSSKVKHSVFAIRTSDLEFFVNSKLSDLPLHIDLSLDSNPMACEALEGFLEGLLVSEPSVPENNGEAGDEEEGSGLTIDTSTPIYTSMDQLYDDIPGLREVLNQTKTTGVTLRLRRFLQRLIPHTPFETFNISLKDAFTSALPLLLMMFTSNGSSYFESGPETIIAALDLYELILSRDVIEIYGGSVGSVKTGLYVDYNMSSGYNISGIFTHLRNLVLYFVESLTQISKQLEEQGNEEFPDESEF